MSHRADRFVIHFAILFLCVLLAMFALFHFMRVNDGRRIQETWLSFLFPGPGNEGGTLDFGEAFRVNLFLINLSLILILESVLIFIFVRYTVPALVISSGVIVGLVAAGQRLFEREIVTRLFARLVRNEYAALGLREAVLLFLLNALLLAFMIAMMHHYRQLGLREQAAESQTDANSRQANAASEHLEALGKPKASGKPEDVEPASERSPDTPRSQV